MKIPLSVALSLIVRPACAALGPRFNTPEAVALLMAIGLQESDLAARHQFNGPATGLWQFERGGGVKGVLNHRATKALAIEWCTHLLYTPDQFVVWSALQDNDLLAAMFARLLLYTDPEPLPALGDGPGAWQYYLRCWRPGKPRPSDWDESYTTAIVAVNATPA